MLAVPSGLTAQSLLAGKAQLAATRIQASRAERVADREQRNVVENTIGSRRQEVVGPSIGRRTTFNRPKAVRATSRGTPTLERIDLVFHMPSSRQKGIPTVFRRAFVALFSGVRVHQALAAFLMFASAATGVESATSLPAGTVIYLRLSTPVSSKTSKNHDAVKATVARDVTTQAGVVIPTGAVVSGRVEKLVRSSMPDERDQLQLSFTGLALPDKSNLQLEGHVSAVENGRETIEGGTI